MEDSKPVITDTGGSFTAIKGHSTAIGPDVTADIGTNIRLIITRSDIRVKKSLRTLFPDVGSDSLAEVI